MKSFPDSLQRGNVLFIILIAVALFGALSYTVASMMRSGNPGMVSEEKAQLYADEVLNLGRAMRQNVQTLKISNGCFDMDISFENSILAGYGHMPAASDACKLFHTDGGAMTYTAPALEWLDMNVAPAVLRGQWFFPANTCVPGTGTAPAGGCDADGGSNEALIAALPFVKKQVCVEINDKMGIDNPGGDPPAETDNAWPVAATKFMGTQADGEQLDVNGTMAGCFEGAGSNTPPSGTYHFYQVLLPR